MGKNEDIISDDEYGRLPVTGMGWGSGMGWDGMGWDGM